ncbi:SMI1/KNR4 family protein [Terribacillus saccharophilus]|uniref:SMI1/KNR4 family protein n=1 Tax=Terribacillus saccharophilus TaxID=361277 RepID=A0A268AG69_9BACI|nr:SMI1/KNR4 family protein [Terribacillus saccharophilus]PAD23094.1 SMI1/KNR4 family protein [Terribacillus saccharophilus]
MTSMRNTNDHITLEDISRFEQEYTLTLSNQYKDFLLKYNGGYPQESSFKISEEEGESLVNKFYGIGDMKGNLAKVYDILEGEIPEGFLSIANDPSGNEILLGLNKEFNGKIYLCLHDIEPEDEMDNMFILADDFTEFINNLY